MKLYAEHLNDRIDELEAERYIFVEKIKKYKTLLKSNDEVDSLKRLLKAKDEHIKQLIDNETKLKSEVRQKEKEISHLESKLLNKSNYNIIKNHYIKGL